MEVALCLRACIEQLGGKAVDLWHIIEKGSEEMSSSEAQNFLKENNKEMAEEKLREAFKACKSGGGPQALHFLSFPFIFFYFHSLLLLLHFISSFFFAILFHFFFFFSFHLIFL